MKLKRCVALLLCCVTLLSLSPVMAADQIAAGSGTATQGQNGGSGTKQGVNVNEEVSHALMNF